MLINKSTQTVFFPSSAEQDDVMSMLLTLIAASAADLRRNHSLYIQFSVASAGMAIALNLIAIVTVQFS